MPLLDKEGIYKILSSVELRERAALLLAFEWMESNRGKTITSVIKLDRSCLA